MKQKITTIIAVILSVFLIGLVHFEYLYYKQDGDPASRRIEIKVQPGATLHQVQAMLVAEGLLDRPEVFRWAAFVTRKEKKIQSGRYLFRHGESVATILNRLAKGEVSFSRVVIPEGFMLTEIAGVLQKGIEIDSTEFMAMAVDTAHLRELGIDAPSLEGYIFPDTYLFSWPLTVRDVTFRMVHRFNEVFSDSLHAMADSLGFTVNEVVTLASVIQAEAVYNSEMPRISAVYHNRLRKGWRLEADPTVAYALGGVRRRLWYKDLRVKSPYNTYRVFGLPPGAICSPGGAALEAAVYPLADCEDLYFVAAGNGRHVFNKTLEDHIKAKYRIRYGNQPVVNSSEESESEQGASEEAFSEQGIEQK
jgi:UPF0755 protein